MYYISYYVANNKQKMERILYFTFMKIHIYTIPTISINGCTKICITTSNRTLIFTIQLSKNSII